MTRFVIRPFPTTAHGSLRLIATAFSAFLLSGLAASAALIPVANYSFETPDVIFANQYSIAGDPLPWHSIATTPSPVGVGAFDNTTFGSPDYVDNVDGGQMAYMFPGANFLFQDISDPAGKFEIGKSYTFTIAAGGAQSLPLDANLQLRLYYRDDLNNRVTVATQSFAFNPSLDPGYINHLFDYSVTSPIVEGTDAWLDKTIGIEISAPGSPAFAYWDIDNARLSVVPEPGTFLFGGAILLPIGLRRRRAADRA